MKGIALAAGSPASGQFGDRMKQLAKLEELRDADVTSNEEFMAKKAGLFARI